MASPTRYFWIFVIVAINLLVEIDSELPTFQSLSSLKSPKATDDVISDCLDKVHWLETSFQVLCRGICPFPIPCPGECKNFPTYIAALKVHCMETYPTTTPAPIQQKCCTSSTDCPDTKICDPFTATCVNCLEYIGCYNPTPICLNGACVECTNSKDCSEYYGFNYVCLYGSCYECNYAAGDDRCNSNYNGNTCLETNMCGCLGNTDCSNCYDNAGQCCCNRTKTCTWDVICSGTTSPPSEIIQ